LALRFLVFPALTTNLPQTTHHSITDITAAVVLAAADITDMDKAECSISRILPVRHPPCRDNNNCALTNLRVEKLGVFVQIQSWKARSSPSSYGRRIHVCMRVSMPRFAHRSAYTRYRIGRGVF
jgi:hypothetical protein